MSSQDNDGSTVAALFPIDHIPFFGQTSHDLSGLFRQLGFTVSPDAKYRSNKYPEALWASSCVFFAESWFDLLRVEESAATQVIRSSGCVFRVDAIEPVLRKLPREALIDRYDLVRTFDSGSKTEIETFDIAQLVGKYHGIAVALASHAWPCLDVLPTWLEHPNSAIGIRGITTAFGGVDELLQDMGETVDVSALRYLPGDQFVAAYGDIGKYNVIGVEVGSLRDTTDCLAANGVPYTIRSGVVVVVPPRSRFAIAFSKG